MALLTAFVQHVRRQHTVEGRLTFEASFVVGGATLAALLVAGLRKAIMVDPGEAYVALGVLAACIGAAAVALGQTAGKLSGNRRAEWLIPALALYSAVIVPSTVLLPEWPGPEVSAVDASSVVAFGAIVALLIAAVRPPERLGSRVSWTVAICAALLSVGLDEAHDAASAPELQLVFPIPLGTAVLVLWWSVSSAVVAAGYWTRSAPLWRVGLGFGVIAAAHLYRAVWPLALAEHGLVFATLRLLGTVVVLLGVAQLLRSAVNRVISERFSHQEDLRLVSIRAEQLTLETAHRAHELRNCLTGLSGLTSILEGLEVDEPRAEARLAVRSELVRMSELLDDQPMSPAVGVYDVARVVREIVALWRVAGLRIEVVVPIELAAVGRARTLAQVLTNLLANCARHAAGSPVTVVAERIGEVVEVHVSDTGSQVGEDPPPQGDGIGLVLSRQLLEADGGGLRLQAHERRGFTAVVELATLPAPRCAADAGAPAYARR